MQVWLKCKMKVFEIRCHEKNRWCLHLTEIRSPQDSISRSFADTAPYNNLEIRGEGEPPFKPGDTVYVDLEHRLTPAP